ncbi:MAG TPA: tripartite tricarboxylate transporter substrate binding protein [Casimicrobiaceae bacterium]|nr:tripartite tricarboxylate transporter substrate binding protein [Casimicrobiaceae bacterium]
MIARFASPRRRLAALSAAVLAAALLAPAASAQEKYPDKPIRMLVGFAPGGPTDVVARKLAARMAPVLGQSVVVENKPGASTTIATAELVKSRPDGYTIYFTGSAALTITPLSIPGLTYDVSRDIAPIALVAAEHLAIGVNPAVPARSLKELAALVKANPGKYSFASSGTGNIGHLTGELFNLQAGKLDMPHVAYKGAGPAMTDVLAGHVPVLAAGLGSMYEQHKAGKLVVLAVTDPKRSTIATEIPTSAEAGFPDLVTTSVFVVLAPAGTPPPVVATLNNAIQKAMGDAEFLKDLRAATVEPITDSTPAKTKQFLDGELTKWADLVKSTGIKLN